MELEETHAIRILVLRMTEDEARRLHSIINYYPVSAGERRTQDAQEFASTLSRLLLNSGIYPGHRSDYILNTDLP